MITHNLLYKCIVVCCLNLEEGSIMGSDDSINNDDKNKKEERKYQKKPEEKTSRQDEVSYFLNKTCINN